jgi:hypothetical protein
MATDKGKEFLKNLEIERQKQDRANGSRASDVQVGKQLRKAQQQQVQAKRNPEASNNRPASKPAPAKRKPNPPASSRPSPGQTGSGSSPTSNKRTSTSKQKDSSKQKDLRGAAIVAAVASTAASTRAAARSAARPLIGRPNPMPRVRVPGSNAVVPKSQLGSARSYRSTRGVSGLRTGLARNVSGARGNAGGGATGRSRMGGIPGLKGR